jgi:trehalose 2-sulfotransferase
MIDEHNCAWRDWFKRVGVDPYEITYEQLAAAPVPVISALCEHFGIDLTDGGPISAADGKQADQINADWAHRYRQRRATNHDEDDTDRRRC